MRFPKNIASVAAFFGIWFCMVAVGRDAFQIESTGYVMAWGVFAFWVSSKVSDWILGPGHKKRKGGASGL